MNYIQWISYLQLSEQCRQQKGKVYSNQMTAFGRAGGHLCKRKWVRVKQFSRAKMVIKSQRDLEYFQRVQENVIDIKTQYSTNVIVQKFKHYCASHSRGIEGIFEVRILYTQRLTVKQLYAARTVAFRAGTFQRLLRVAKRDQNYVSCQTL